MVFGSLDIFGSRLSPDLWIASVGPGPWRHKRWLCRHGAQWAFGRLLWSLWQVRSTSKHWHIEQKSDICQLLSTEVSMVWVLDVSRCVFFGILRRCLQCGAHAVFADLRWNGPGFCTCIPVKPWRLTSSTHRLTLKPCRQSSGKKGGPSAWLTLVDNQIWVHRFWDTMDQRRFSYILSTCLKTPAPRIQAWASDIKSSLFAEFARSWWNSDSSHPDLFQAPRGGDRWLLLGGRASGAAEFFARVDHVDGREARRGHWHPTGEQRDTVPSTL